MKRTLLFALFGLLIGSSVAFGQTTKAIAVLHPTQGSNVAGTVTFSASGDQVKIVADITGLTPGKHGFHIHEFGDCSDAKAASAGGHFNPEHKQHGAPDAGDRHAGDLGNIEADASGKAHLDITDKVMKLSGSDSIVGHAVIVHEKADDLKTQPTGDAGGRLACGVIGIAKP
jgi:Cu-Zn family superoxide dismutase